MDPLLYGREAGEVFQRAIRNGCRRQACQRQYQEGTRFGATGRAPTRWACCQAASWKAQFGIACGTDAGRCVGRTTTGADGWLTFEAASTAVTRKTDGRWLEKPRTEALGVEAVASGAPFSRIS